MNVQVIALHVECDACGDTARLTLEEQWLDWAVAHFQPNIVRAEALVDGRHQYLPVRMT